MSVSLCQKKPRTRAKPEATLSSLAQGVNFLRSEIRVNNQQLQNRLTQLHDDMRTGFDQLYRHVDGFVKLHEAHHRVTL